MTVNKDKVKYKAKERREKREEAGTKCVCGGWEGLVIGSGSWSIVFKATWAWWRLRNRAGRRALGE